MLAPAECLCVFREHLRFEHLGRAGHRYLAQLPQVLLADEVSRMTAEGRYEATAFLIRNQGFVTATAARRISFEDSLIDDRRGVAVYSAGLFAVTPGFAVMSGLVVRMVPMGPGWQQLGGRPGFNVPDCRFVPD
jgi:hypothetical protein